MVDGLCDKVGDNGSVVLAKVEPVTESAGQFVADPELGEVFFAKRDLADGELKRDGAEFAAKYLVVREMRRVGHASANTDIVKRRFKELFPGANLAWFNGTVWASRKFGVFQEMIRIKGEEDLERGRIALEVARRRKIVKDTIGKIASDPFLPISEIARAFNAALGFDPDAQMMDPETLLLWDPDAPISYPGAPADPGAEVK